MRQTSLGPVLREVLTVEDPAQAVLLADPWVLRFFSPFLARERSASQAAREAGVGLERMPYRVKQFVQCGLLRVTREERRAARRWRSCRLRPRTSELPFLRIGRTA